MRIGCLGLGNMGQPMASKLLDAGHELWVCDVREEAILPLLERQARRATSPKELADTCDTIIVSLPSLKIFRHALSGPDGLLAGKAVRTLINTCTVGVPFVREIEFRMRGGRRYRHRCPDQRRRRGSQSRYAGHDGVRKSGQSCRANASVPAVGQDDRRCRRQAGGCANNEAYE